MIVWLDRRLVLAIHDRQIAEHSGSAGLRDESLLESALARPQQLYAYGEPIPDLAELAASLAFGIARNHAFVDGNKRTAFVACRVFIALNGAELNATTQDKYLRFLAMAEGSLSLQDFTEWLRQHIATPPPLQIQESPPPRSRKSAKT